MSEQKIPGKEVAANFGENGFLNEMSEEGVTERLGQIRRLYHYGQPFLYRKQLSLPEEDFRPDFWKLMLERRLPLPEEDVHQDFWKLSEKIQTLFDYAEFDLAEEARNRDRYYFSGQRLFVFPKDSVAPWDVALVKFLASRSICFPTQASPDSPDLLYPAFLFRTYQEMATMGIAKNPRYLGNNCLGYSPIGTTICFYACLDTQSRFGATGPGYIQDSDSHETTHVYVDRRWREILATKNLSPQYYANPRQLIAANSGLYELAANDFWFNDSLPHRPSPATTGLREKKSPYLHHKASLCNLLSLDYSQVFLKSEGAQELEDLFYPCQPITIGGHKIEIPYITSPAFINVLTRIQLICLRINKKRKAKNQPPLNFLTCLLDQIEQDPLAEHYFFPPDFFPTFYEVAKEWDWKNELEHPLMEAGLGGKV
ncbi:hypothetical protein ACFLZP_04760 [Patescibacteria group bacterium]